MKDYRIEILVRTPGRVTANLAHSDFVVVGGAMVEQMKAADVEGQITVGPLVEIETMQLVGVKDGREVDLGDMPLSPEMKAREIARQYGNPDDENDDPASYALRAMQELIKWMKEQGKLK